MSSERALASDHPPSGRTSARERDPFVGRVIHEKFKLVSLIARGGMGKVYRAEQAPLGRICAVKILVPPTGADPEEFRKRFFLEASIGARLTHPNTVTIFDYGVTDDGTYFIAMEYLEGRTLAKVLREASPFDETRATHVARQICRSLREAHALGVVHRDLKPANVYLVDHGDEKDTVKVLDFGLVKDLESDTEDLTQTGLFMGSPKYMAPEQIRGEPCDARTDVYSLGVILYEMVTGGVPFDKQKQVDTLLAHVHEPVPPLRSRRPDLAISPVLEELVLRCLGKHPSERPASMDQVLLALKQVDGSAYTATRTSGIDVTASVTPPPATLPRLGQTGSGEHAALPIAPSAKVESPRTKRPFVAAIALVGIAAAAGILVSKQRPEAPPSATAAAESEPAAKVEAPAVAESAAPAAKVVEAVEIDSEPRGAKVRDDAQAIVCDTTPCSLRIDGAAMTLTIEAEGFEAEKIRIAAGDPRRIVKLTKKPVWKAPPTPVVAPKPVVAPAAPPKPTSTTPYRGDPYGSGPY
jgi:serine/threonine-protein kinase